MVGIHLGYASIIFIVLNVTVIGGFRLISNLV